MPFSEDFPLKGFFPEYYQQSVRSGRYWLEGEKMKLLKFKEILIGTPICLEDTFSEIGEKMAKIGATQSILRQSFSLSLYQIWSHKGIDKKRLFNILTPEFYRTLPAGTSAISQAIIDKYNYRLHEKIQYVLKNGVFHFS